MNAEEKLKKTRNYIRFLITSLYEPIDILCRQDYSFSNKLQDDGVEVGVLEERRPGLFYLTPDETVSKPRHRGKRYA